MDDKDGRSYGGNLLIVDGAASEFKSSASNFIGLGINNADNTIVVKNGGKVSGWMLIGSNQIYSTNNLFSVIGAGSSFLSGKSGQRFDVGVVGGFNKAEFLDGATMDVAGYVNVGSYGPISNEANKYGYKGGGNNTLLLDGDGTIGTVKHSDGIYVGNGSSSNKFIVGSGSVLTNCGMLRIGWISPSFPDSLPSNTCGNVFEVAPGGRVVHGTSASGSLFVIDNASYGTGNVLRVKGSYCLAGNRSACYVGESGVGDMLEVDGGTLAMTNCGNLVVGKQVNCGSGYHRIRVVNGGLMEHRATSSTFITYIGYDAPNCRMEVDNATFRLIPCDCTSDNHAANHIMSANVAIGGVSASAANCSLSCVNGALVDVRRIVVGDQAPNCVLAVTNATVNIESTLNIGYHAGAQNSTVILAGTNATVVVGGGVTLEQTSKLIYSFPVKGEISSPVIRCASLTTGNTPSIKVEVERGRRNRRSVTLLKADNAINDTTYNRISFDLPPGVSIERTDNEIIAHIHSAGGTIFTIR